MRITDVEPIVLRLPQVDATRADGTQDAFLVRIHTDEGVVGVGEADTAPLLARTIVEMPSSHSLARGLREVLVGEDPLQIDRLWQRMFHASDHYGRRGAALHVISAIDIALWDLAGKVAGRPVSELLGGRRLERVPVYASEVMPETPDEVRRIAGRAVEDGYSALKLGWGPLGRDLAFDEKLVRAARETLGPDRTLMLDGGRAYTVKRALELLRRVEEHRLYWFEEALQPDDLDGYRRLAEPSDVRIAAGEADETLAPFRALVEQGRDRRAAARPGALRRVHGGTADRAARALVGGGDRARTASRRESSSPRRCTSSPRSTVPPGRSTRSPTRRS